MKNVSFLALFSHIDFDDHTLDSAASGHLH